MKRFRRKLQIIFTYPTIHGLRDKKGEFYNPRNQTCYIFQKESTDDETHEHLIQCINHAELHYIIQVIEGTSKSRKFDNAAKLVRKWNKTVYTELY